MISEMTKQAGMALGERVKVAAAILTMYHYDKTQEEMLKEAGLREVWEAANRPIDIDTPIKDTARRAWERLNEPIYIKALQDLEARLGLSKQSSYEQAVVETALDIQKRASAEFGVQLSDELAVQAALEAINELK